MKTTDDRYFGLSPRIAKWRDVNPIEYQLGRLADSSEFWKRLYMLYYRLSNPKYYTVGGGLAKAELDARRGLWAEQDEKRLIRDMIYCLHRFGFKYEEYWVYGLMHRNTACRKTFVSDKLRYHYCDILNSPDILPLTTDKWACYLRFKPFYKREMVLLAGPESRQAFIDFASRNPRFIYKPLTEHSGRGIEMVSARQTDLNAFLDRATADGHRGVVEELIEQGTEAAAMHPGSVNSVRVTTFTIGQEMHIIRALWRIGAGGAFVDNAGAGGMYAGIDARHGFVETDAVTYKGAHYNIHPDTGVQIVGYRLPEWDKALRLLHEMATHVEGATLVSWDIAYSRKGWLMVEANDNGDWTVLQGNKKEGKKAELYALMDQYFKNKKQ